MGLLNRLGRRLRDSTSGAIQAGLMGAGWGGGMSALGGGNPEQIGRAALIGGLSGAVGGYAGGPYSGWQPMLGAFGGGTAAGLSNRGDPTEAAARMILQHAPSPEAIPRTAEVLFGAPLSGDETGVGVNGRANIYGIAAVDRAMLQGGADREAAVQRAYELLQERQQERVR